MDFVRSAHRKASYLDQQGLGSLLLKLQTRIHGFLMQEHDLRLFSPALSRSLTFDLTYLLIRQRAWHNAPILSELSIDFLCSEFQIPRHLGTQLVENSLDLLHSYTPIEIDWTAEKYEEEFLEHLFVCSTLATNDEELADDIGFGRNLIELLRTAVRLDQDAETAGLFQFAPELASKLYRIMSRIFIEQEACPWILDLYRLKNILQREPYTKKKTLTPEYLNRLFNILLCCNWQGNDAKTIAGSGIGEHLSSDLGTLSRCGLVYEESRRRPLPSLIRLSAKGLELTRAAFAFAACAVRHPALKGLPAIYQAAVLERLLSHPSEDRMTWMKNQTPLLTPEALRLLIEILKQQQKDETLLEVFENLLHNHAHAWIRAEICEALPLADKPDVSQNLLRPLASQDPSPMVRQAARAALKRQARMASKV
ncbi:HEAT repeat domain-containing protein [Oligoflexus tunisiensis]|uniref:HEAT repeat domain-containing protein n=1 Tax=Oligoflexus tunisiensis TaxID=708132 RepID=UPI00159F1D1C|nr:HEAT repeat domain-containing protein [Oligoflexus tunisiensis]